MLRSNFMRILLVAGSVLILIGVILMTWMLLTEDDRNVIVVNIDGKIPAIKFESLKLIPGGECEYTITLKGDNAKEYEFFIDFAESEEKTLKHFARVKIISNNEVVYDELLADAFESEALKLPVDFNIDLNTELKIVYYMPLEVGNEAKNAEAKFELLLKAINE